jgi:hypothetical protein
MKKYLVILFGVLITACNSGKSTEETPEKISPDAVIISATASGENEAEKRPAFEFTETNYDFGTINSGQEVSHDYRFKNTGNADLIISQVKASCGCTQPKYPENPIPPGEEGVISVTFRSEGIAGQVVKDITILANTLPTTKVLTISGEVIKVNKKVSP